MLSKEPQNETEVGNVSKTYELIKKSGKPEANFKADSGAKRTEIYETLKRI